MHTSKLVLKFLSILITRSWTWKSMDGCHETCHRHARVNTAI